jgi:hypothetical protein
MKLADLIRFLTKNGGSVKLQIDRADPDLIAEAIARGCKHRSWSDAQCLGRFHHYTLREDRVEIELITTRPVDEKEAKAAAYMGYTLKEYRALKEQS